MSKPFLSGPSKPTKSSLTDRHSLTQIHVGAGRDSSGKASHWPMRTEFVAFLNAAYLESKRPSAAEEAQKAHEHIQLMGSLQLKVNKGLLISFEEALELLNYSYPILSNTLQSLFYDGLTEKESARQAGVVVQTINYRKNYALKLLTKWTKNAASTPKQQAARSPADEQ